MVFCPFCEQGVVCKAKVKRLNEVIFICDECDTVWRTPEINDKVDCETFEIYMAKFRFGGLWAELEDINRNW